MKNLKTIVIVLAVILLVLVAVACVLLLTEGDPAGPAGTTAATGKDPYQVEVQIRENDPVDLGSGLQLLRAGSYAGIYMEDGSDEIVADVQMIIVKNISENDLQLARIDLMYDSYTAEFEVTNLPAGESVLLLEKNRREAASVTYTGFQVRNVVYFEEKMSLREDVLELSGADGTIRVTNISQQDISGSIYIYYKNSADDLLYGGITYRVPVGGLAAGETAVLLTGHYDPEGSRFMMADIIE